MRFEFVYATGKTTRLEAGMVGGQVPNELAVPEVEGAAFGQRIFRLRSANDDVAMYEEA